MLNLRTETSALVKRVEVLSNQKWDAIANASRNSHDTSNRLFDEVGLVLSGIEGKLKFATDSKVWDKSIQNIEDDFTREVVAEAKEMVAKTRKALTAIIAESRENVDKLLDSPCDTTGN